MPLFIARLWNKFLALLLKRIILVLALLLCVAMGVALSNMAQLSSSLIEAQAVQNAAQYTQAFNQAITLYSDAAVERAKAVDGIAVTHAYLNKKGSIPLPSTFALELGDRISEQNDGMSFRLYSDYPFPWRKAKGGAKDAFERDAIEALRQRPNQKFQRFENKDGHLTLRYAEASIMKPTCVACHNTHLSSPKKDWEVGDLAGVWEITQPLDSFVTKMNQKLKGTFMMLGGMSVLGLSGLTLVVGKLRHTARDLEHRVKQRTSDLALVNDELEQRNHLIRQVFGRYLSDSVVANLLENPEGLKLGGDRRKITILTSDLRGFTALSERLAPEEVIQILNLYLEHMAEVINQYQGTIDEFMGDGILVLFGAPIARSDDALRAIACACAMQLTMGAVNQQMRGLGLPQLQMGIGINTGEVVVGNIGSEKRTKYGIVGSPVNLTYRIESYTKGGQILISEPTLREVGSSVRISGNKQVQPKGVPQPINVYEVYGIGGRYNLYLPREEENFVPVRGELLLQYAIVQGKQIDDTVFQGRVVKLSTKGAEVQAAHFDQVPPAFANLKLNFLDFLNVVGEDCYAKVSEQPAALGHFYIEFTAISPAVQTQLDRLYDSIA